MKMSHATFAALKALIDKKLNGDASLIERYEGGEFPLSERVKDLNTRFQFDLFYNVRQDLPDSAKEELYTMMDSHIQTALRKIVPTITRRY